MNTTLLRELMTDDLTLTPAKIVRALLDSQSLEVQQAALNHLPDLLPPSIRKAVRDSYLKEAASLLPRKEFLRRIRKIGRTHRQNDKADKLLNYASRFEKIPCNDHLSRILKSDILPVEMSE